MFQNFELRNRVEILGFENRQKDSKIIQDTILKIYLILLQKNLYKLHNVQRRNIHYLPRSPPHPSAFKHLPFPYLTLSSLCEAGAKPS
jgi:hypothetical protein